MFAKYKTVWRVSALALVALIGAFPASAQSAFSKERVQEHLQYLASDELRGRGSGDVGNQKAARYIAKEFASYGLKPLGTRRQNDTNAPIDGSGYFQPFTFNAGRTLGKQNRLSVEHDGKTTKYRAQKDFQPSTLSSPGEAQGEVVFAGYGIHEPKANHDDYQGVEIKDRVVLLLSGTPGNAPNSPLAEFGDMRRKAFNAREAGAKAVIVVLPKESDPQDLTRFTDATSAHFGIPITRVRYAVAEEWLGAGVLDSAKAQADKGETVSRALNVKVSLQTDVPPQTKVTANVIGFIEGSDPILKNEVVIVGAHLDHLGMGGAGSLSRSSKPMIHYGADDNASGTTGVLMLAAHFGGSGANRPVLKRSLILMCFSGEEMGLLGSAYYTRKPILPLERVTAMLNMDMIGRMKNDEMILGGTGTAKEWKEIFTPANEGLGIKISSSDNGFGASDHFSFFLQNKPVLFFFTGLHPDYHTPTDTVDKINFEGVAKVIQLVANCLERTANLPTSLTFQKPLQTAQSTGAGRGGRVYFGSIPNYSATVVGVLLDGVREGSPAEKGGLKQGDIIIKFGEKSVKNVEDYTVALQQYKPGDKVPVTVKRGNDTIVLMVTLAARKE